VRRIDENLHDRTECAVLQGDDADFHAIEWQVNGQNLDLPATRQADHARKLAASAAPLRPSPRQPPLPALGAHAEMVRRQSASGLIPGLY
jgi:hypothetical protein